MSTNVLYTCHIFICFKLSFNLFERFYIYDTHCLWTIFTLLCSKPRHQGNHTNRNTSWSWHLTCYFTIFIDTSTKFVQIWSFSHIFSLGIMQLCVFDFCCWLKSAPPVSQYESHSHKFGAFQSFLLLSYEQKRNRQTHRTTENRYASRPFTKSAV